MKLIGIIVTLVLLSACCPSTTSNMIDEYKLSEIEKTMFSYKLNQELDFVNSLGEKIKVKVTKCRIENIDYPEDECIECFCKEDNDYFRVERRTIELKSNYPYLCLDFNFSGNMFNMEDTTKIRLTLNQLYSANYSIDSLGEFYKTNSVFYDSILLNNKYYYNVIESAIIYDYLPIDTLRKSISKIYFNNKGLLKFTTFKYPISEFYWVE